MEHILTRVQKKYTPSNDLSKCALKRKKEAHILTPVVKMFLKILDS